MLYFNAHLLMHAVFQCTLGNSEFGISVVSCLLEFGIGLSAGLHLEFGVVCFPRDAGLFVCGGFELRL